MRILYLICSLLLIDSLTSEAQIGDLKTKLQHAKGDSQTIAAYKEIIVYYSVKNPDSQARYANEALNFAAKNRYKHGEADIIAQLAVLDENQGRITSGKQRTDHALAIYRELNDLSGVAEMLHNLGAIEAGKGNYDIALKYLISALKVYDTITDYHGQMLAYMNLGSLYLEHHDTANAEKYLHVAEKISQKIPLSHTTIFLYNIIGVMYAEKGNTDTALQIFLHDLELSDKPGFVNSHVESILYIGECYMDRGEPAKALKYLEQGLVTARENNLPEMEANLLGDIAKIREKSDPALAIAHLTQAKALCEQIQSKSFLANIYEQMAAVYEQTGNYKDALAATRQKEKLTDSLYNVNKATEIASLGETYELEKSTLRVSQLETLSEKNAAQRNATVAIALVIIVILIVLFVYYRKTVNLNKRLMIREQELEDLNSMKDKLFSVIGHDLRGPIARIPAIIDIYEDEQTGADEKKFLLDSLKEHTKSSLETLDKLLFWGLSLVKGIRISQIKMQPKNYIKESIELRKIKAAEKNIGITDNTPDNIYVFADPTHFDFVIRNLLANALKYAYPGGLIEINADLERKPGFVVFSVKDNGIGIDTALLLTIFSALKSGAGTQNEKGTGIGLMLCKEFVTMNGGEIWVESTPGKGATFFFSLKKAG